MNRGTIGVNSLPKTRQRRDCDLNSGYQNIHIQMNEKQETDCDVNFSLSNGKILLIVYTESLQRKTLVTADRSHHEHQCKSTCTTHHTDSPVTTILHTAVREQAGGSGNRYFTGDNLMWHQPVRSTARNRTHWPLRGDRYDHCMVTGMTVEWWQVWPLHGDRYDHWVVTGMIIEWWQVWPLSGDRYDRWVVTGMTIEWWQVWPLSGDRYDHCMVTGMTVEWWQVWPLHGDRRDHAIPRKTAHLWLRSYVWLVHLPHNAILCRGLPHPK